MTATTTLFNTRCCTLHREIEHLSQLLEQKRHRATTIQHLFAETATALSFVADALPLMPEEVASSLKAAILNLFPAPSTQPKPLSVSHTEGCLAAARKLVPYLGDRRSIETKILQQIMIDAFGGSDAEGCWRWKDSYEAIEAALVLFLRQQGNRIQGGTDQDTLTTLQQLESLYPTHTRRTEETEAFQQFSTPLPLGYIAAVAAAITEEDTVLEPSAGTGLLAIWAQIAGAKLILNELWEKRRSLLEGLFPETPVFAYNAEQINDYLPEDVQPTIALLNPPFSASPNRSKRNPEATAKHITSALARLPEGGRLVAITADWFTPTNKKWRDTFIKFQQCAQVVFSAGIPGKVYRKQGTSINVRLTVIDKKPAPDAATFAQCYDLVENVEALLALVRKCVPPRWKPEVGKATSKASTLQEPLKFAPAAVSPSPVNPESNGHFPSAIALNYKTRDWQGQEFSDSLYEAYEPQTIVIEGAAPHPSPLVQSAAMASIVPPKPNYTPHLPERLIREGILSAAQLESIIYAGQAHSEFLSGAYVVNETLEQVKAAPEDAENAVRFRRGWYLGDGTGAGKGRQVSGIILDSWLQGRRKALWISKSDKLIEDGRRDWTALGGSKEQIVPLAKFRQGETIQLPEGIIFATYGILRVGERQGKKSRVQQLIDWLGKDFDGCIIFDECHAMGAAIAEKGTRGMKKPSQQGLAGLRLQNGVPGARIAYVSATGASRVSNLAYAARLGLWQTGDFPFASQSDFIASVEQGGIAAMEVVSRDLKALGLYAARSLSYQGVEYEMLEHQLTPAQVEIYDAYAEAFKIIHQNLEEALKATNIVASNGQSRNGTAKSAAKSAFESNKQRFFNHLLVSMKMPTVLKAIERDLADGHGVVVQIVSTNEALLDRRLAKIPPSEWDDINVDVTPREYIFDYLHHAFPVQLHEVYADEEGNEYAKPVIDSEGNPVLSQDALKQRDALIEQLALLPPIQGALDQIIHHFGYENVAEITGRSKRIVRETKGGRDYLCVQKRPASANISEAEAFMDDRKRILVFSEAGGVGRSYHASLHCKNQRLRSQYLVESGWKAESAIQGLGRSNRTNQKQPPVFRPVTTNVKGEKRFISTIARRLDSLGALTRGQRQTGTQGLFREEDNLESIYARMALRQLYHAIFRGTISCCTLEEFEEATGLSLRSSYTGYLREDLPPINQFLNRLLALPIALQNQLFAEFELRLESRIEEAKSAGTYEIGVETLKAESFRVLERKVIYTHKTGAQTQCCKVEQRDKTRVLSLEEALTLAEQNQGRLLHNSRSDRVAVEVPTNSIVGEDGSVNKQVSLVRPLGNEKMKVSQMASSFWQEIDSEVFCDLWRNEVTKAPEYTVKTFYLITGLLLPIWNRLDAQNMRVYRLQTDDGEQILGRMVPAENISAVYRNLGLDAPEMSAEEIYQAVLENRRSIPVGRWELRSSMVSGRRRLEVAGVHQRGDRDWLKSLGCVSEIIDWRMRVFVPANDNGIPIIEKLKQCA